MVQMGVIHPLQGSLLPSEVVGEVHMQLDPREDRGVVVMVKVVMRVVPVLLVREMQEVQVQVVQTVIQVVEVVPVLLALPEDPLLLLIHPEELEALVLRTPFQGPLCTMQGAVVVQSPLILSVEHLETV
jgi:hypothetical protein